MMIRIPLFLLTGFWLLVAVACPAQITNVVILDSAEIVNLRNLIATHHQIKMLYDSVARLAQAQLGDPPRPLEVIHYEGLLDTNPDRIDTQKSLNDMDKVVHHLYASYGSDDARYARKVRQLVLAWATTYRPTGNTINEHKFCPLFWGYYLFRDQFTMDERQMVERWMTAIARAQIDRPHTPNNNWQAKRMKIIGIVGCITENETMKDFSVAGLKQYIRTSYYADGSSQDLIQRDALHYHIGGIKPLLATFINLTRFDPAFELFTYTSPEGASIEKSVQYTLPYATGAKTREEWVNSSVELDHQRAAAGLEKYQPGKLFDPEQAVPLFSWAAYYNPTWYAILGDSSESGFTATWVGLLNSPLVRTR